MIWSEKLGHEIGTYNSLGGLRINAKPFRQSTENTIVTCLICKGTGLNAITHPNGLVTLNPCVRCKGIKRISNRVPS
jgi:hypothetical protein